MKKSIPQNFITMALFTWLLLGFNPWRLTALAKPPAQLVAKVSIVNCDNGAETEIKDGSTALTTARANIKAITSPAAVGSVAFNLDGNPRTFENFAPYFAGGDVDGRPNIWPLLTAGTHKLTVTPFTQAGCTGTPGKPTVLTFTLTTTIPPVVPPPATIPTTAPIPPPSTAPATPAVIGSGPAAATALGPPPAGQTEIFMKAGSALPAPASNQCWTLAAGTYDGNLVVGAGINNFTIRGVDEKTVILRGTAGSTIVADGTNLAVRNLSIDSTNSASPCHAFSGAGKGLFFSHITSKTVEYFWQGERQPTDVTIEDCTIVSPKGYGAWVSGKNWIIRRCRIEKAGLHNIRLGGVVGLLVEDCQLLDPVLGNVNLQKGSQITVRRNLVTGASIGIGPLGGPTGVSDPSGAATDALIESNDISNNAGIEFSPGCARVIVRNNLIRRDNAQAFWVKPSDSYNTARTFTDITIDKNTLVSAATQVCMIRDDGVCAAGFTVSNNLMVAPKWASAPDGSSRFVVDIPGQLKSFKAFSGNIWPVSQWVSATAWNALPQVAGRDVFKAAAVDAKGNPNDSTITAGARR